MSAAPRTERSLVVGAAVLRSSRVLAARRTRPARAQGRWELPGGKVEPGESPQEAVVREIHEELGCAIRVTGRLPGHQRIGPRLRLRVLLAELEPGAEPVPREHDALRWLGPEELDEVDWLDSDRPFVGLLRDRLLDGERLRGGNVGGAVRIGGTVRRATGPWTPAVHRLLAHLRDAGLPHVPEVLGLDARGREVLGYLPGRVVDVDHELLADDGLAELTRWTRALHDAVGDHRDDGPWRFFGVEGATVLAHNDLAPYNVCWQGSRLSGVFDWDLAGPSTPLLELAHLAWNAVPLHRERPAREVARRLDLMATAYGGGVTAAALLAAVPVRVRLAVDGIRQAVANGDEQMRGLLDAGAPERMERRLATLAGGLAEIRRELR